MQILYKYFANIVQILCKYCEKYCANILWWRASKNKLFQAYGVVSHFLVTDSLT